MTPSTVPLEGLSYEYYWLPWDLSDSYSCPHPNGGGKSRVIDLSEAAAKRIGIRERGTEWVQVLVIENAS